MEGGFGVSLHAVRKGSCPDSHRGHKVLGLRLQGFHEDQGANNEDSESSVTTAVFFMLRREEKLVFPSEGAALFAVKSVSPESGRAFEKRSKVRMHTNKNIVSLEVLSSDSHALKASVHSYLRLLGLCRAIAVGGAGNGGH